MSATLQAFLIIFLVSALLRLSGVVTKAHTEKLSAFVFSISFVLVDAPTRRTEVKDSFLAANANALAGYEGERAQLYSTLKLEGLETAPVQLAVFCDESTSQGRGLGRRTMPETLSYSVVASIQTLWLAARANGIGVGWVSILNAADIKKVLDVPESWSFIAYLCVGFPEDNACEPKLANVGWEQRQNIHEFILQR